MRYIVLTMEIAGSRGKGAVKCIGKDCDRSAVELRELVITVINGYG